MQMENIKIFLKKYKTSQLVVAFILFWIPVIIFLRIAGEILEREPISQDIHILEWIRTQASPTLDTVFVSITTLGDIEFMLPITLLLLGLLLYKRHRRHASIIFFGVGGAAIGNLVMKLLFQRDRPEFWQSIISEVGYSFPSGHAMLSSALILCIIAILWKTNWRTLSIIFGAILIVLIGFSRLYLGVHYPTDVIAGWSVSAAWIAIVVVLTKAASYELHKHDAPKAIKKRSRT